MLMRCTSPARGPCRKDRSNAGGLAGGEHGPIETQRLADRPRLKRAAARRVRRVAVGDLGEMAEARLAEMREQRLEKATARLGDRLRGAAADADPCLHERAHEPRPDGALVVRTVALADAALVARPVPGLVGRERAEAERGEQPRLDGVDDAASAFAFERREGKAADREDLVRTEGRVDRAG